MSPSRLVSAEDHVGVEFESGNRKVRVTFAREGECAGRISVTGAPEALDRPLSNAVQKQAAISGEAQ
ncbi:MAG: hypothetical protein J7M19_06795 [Planctomycetes bacterium]|nr:hypothetical protein [Planctomycetota bacterium]